MILYSADYGVVKIDMSETPAYVYDENSGVIHKIIRGERKVRMGKLKE